MVTLVQGILFFEDVRGIKIVNLVAYHLAAMLRINGDRIKLHTLNRSLYDLSATPTSKEFKAQLKWSGIHHELVRLIHSKVPEISCHSNRSSAYEIREDITMTLATMKNYLYF